MADAKTEKKFFDQLQDAIKGIPGFNGDAKKAALEFLDEKAMPTDKALLDAMEDKAKTLVETDEFKRASKLGAFHEVQNTFTQENLNLNGLATEKERNLAQVKANAKYAEQIIEKDIKEFDDQGHTASSINTEIQGVIKAKNPDAKSELAKLNTALSNQAKHYEFSEKTEAFSDSLVAAGKESAAATSEFANRIHGKAVGSVEDFHKHYGKIYEEQIKAHQKDLDEAAEALKAAGGDPYTAAVKEASGFKDRAAQAKTHFTDTTKNLLENVKGDKVVIDHEAHAESLVGKAVDTLKTEHYTNAHATEHAIESLAPGKGNIVVSETKENMATIAKNVGSKFKTVASEVGAKAGKGMGKAGVIAAVAAGTVGTLAIANAVSKDPVLDANGNPTVDEAGKTETRTNALKFAAVTGLVVGAAFLGDKMLNKGKALDAVKTAGKEIFGGGKASSWLERTLASKAIANTARGV